MFLLDGKKLALHLQLELKIKIDSVNQRKPGLAVVLVGDDSASHAYVKMKEKACHALGIQSFRYHKSSSITESDLLDKIKELNNNPEIDGILVQFPLPNHINPYSIIHAIDPNKDVDCFHPLNVGKLVIGEKDGFVPCTPGGIQLLLKHYNIEVAGKNVVIIGRSNLVGKPLANLLLQKDANATVTVAHSYTKHLKNISKEADILIAAMGQPNFITADMVKKDATVIDVGIHRIFDKSTNTATFVGDVEFNAVKEKCSSITPVPGGVGPMTIACLMQNTYKAYLRNIV